MYPRCDVDLATIMTALALAIIRPDASHAAADRAGPVRRPGACLLLAPCAPITVINCRRASRSAITRSPVLLIVCP